MRTSTYNEHVRDFRRLYPNLECISESEYTRRTVDGEMFLTIHYETGPKGIHLTTLKTREWNSAEGRKDVHV
jgi:hypothetical protein